MMMWYIWIHINNYINDECDMDSNLRAHCLVSAKINGETVTFHGEHIKNSGFLQISYIMPLNAIIVRRTDSDAELRNFTSPGLRQKRQPIFWQILLVRIFLAEIVSCKSTHFWLVVSNMNFIFHSIYWIILPIDFHIFQDGLKPPTNILLVTLEDL